MIPETVTITVDVPIAGLSGEYNFNGQDILPLDFSEISQSNNFQDFTKQVTSDKGQIFQFTYGFVESEYYALNGANEYFNKKFFPNVMYHVASNLIVGEIIVKAVKTDFYNNYYTTAESYKKFGSVTGTSSRYYNIFSTAIGYFISYLPSEFIPNNYVAPSTLIAPFDTSSSLSFLYTFGEFLSGTASDFEDILNLQVGSTNLWTLIFGSGFLIYAGWIIIKFIIPT